MLFLAGTDELLILRILRTSMCREEGLRGMFEGFKKDRDILFSV